MKHKRIFSMLLVLAVIFGMIPVKVFADAAPSVTVYLTVSNQGVLASDNDGKIMANREVTVKDIDQDGKLTYDEALIAAHKAYKSEADYVSETGQYGVSVLKLWGVETGNTLFFINGSGLNSGVGTDTVLEGDKLVASVNSDNTYYSDWYTSLDEQEKTVKTNDEFTLTLRGHIGMAWTPEDMADVALTGISVGIWENGSFTAIDEKVTDEDGSVKLSFSEAGTYYVTADGIVRDTITDWTNGGISIEADCPIIAPVCVVTVEEATEPEEPIEPIKDSPDEVCSYLPAPGQFVNLDGYSSPGNTLSSSGLITLGAFGGNVVYKYDVPIENNPNNPYGIDFIVVGNCFSNGDKSTSKGAAEPASVMVSKDGETWYELAGSEYYAASTRRNLTVTYTNKDTSFSAASDTLWTDSNGESGILPKNDFHSQPYYPNPQRYNVYQNGIGKNNTYTAESVSFTGNRIEPGFYPFGYADSHSEVSSMGNKAVNPYVKNHETSYNGDGFDLAWAVDEDGNQVILDEISYIKIYNPVMNSGDATGEKSPEIKTVLRAMPKDSAVGVSNGLRELIVNGENISLSDDTFVYNIDGNSAGSLIIKPTSVNEDANIYVSNQRVTSGESSSPIAAVNKLRIIVQEDEKEPAVYILNFTNVASADSNAELSSVKLTPGDDIKAPDEDGKIVFSVANSVSAIRFTPETANKHTQITLSGENFEEDISLSSGTQSDALELDIGKNVFNVEVTSENKKNTKSYTVIVTRANSGSGSAGSSGQNTIKVRFSLTGDRLHYDNDKKVYTAPHANTTWIAAQSIEIPAGSTVKYVTEMMLNNLGLSYKSDGIYVSEINGLAEFDNGPNSGWLYRHNGRIASEGYAARTLSSGDVIKWFYTDDYTKEKDYEGNWDKTNSSSGSGSGSSGSKKDALDVENTVVNNTKEETSAVDTSLYADVKKDAWYYEAVKYVTEKGLMNGTEDGFEPDCNMTRAMIVTVLYRLENKKTAVKSFSFSDVPEDEWYTDAVSWAAENGIVKGISETMFAPEESITREQLAVIIYRYANLKGLDTKTESELSEFRDSSEISKWAYDALQWANGAELIKGTSEDAVSPASPATRAQIAEILMRFCENVVK